ncbi:HWE histidine kinase domain-containing protein [Salinarimonas soli]|nr:HWE histidine kinase domain-containing protein [Salinarimonas soli]
MHATPASDDALAPDLRRFIAERVASGAYGSPDEVLRAAFQALAAQEKPPRNPADEILDGILQSRTTGFAVLDLTSGRTLAVNDYALALAGVSREAFERGDWTGIAPGGESNRDAVAQLLARGWCDPYDTDWPGSQGRPIPVRISSGTLLPGDPPRAVVQIEDLRPHHLLNEALEESRLLFQSLFEAAPLHAGVVEERGEDFVYVVTNRAIAERLGLAEGGLDGRSLVDLGFTQAQSDAWRDLMRRCHADGRPLTLEFELAQNGRSLGWFHGTFTPLPPGPSRGARTSFVATEVTEQKQMMQALRESEARLRSLTDNLPNGLVYQLERDPDGALRFTYISGAVERLHGLTAEAVLADFELLDSQVLEEFRPVLEAARRHGAENGLTLDIEIPMRAPSGEVRWFRRTSAPRMQENGVQVWDGVEIDVTERRRAAEAARDRSHELETVLATVPAAVWFTHDRDVRHVVRNRYAMHLMGLDPEATQSFGSAGIPHIRLMRDGEAVTARDMPLQRAVRGERLHEEEYAFVFADGRVHTLLSSAAPLQDEAGHIVGAVSVGLDITERKRAEEQRMLLIHELNHRVKNTLATVQAIAVQSLRGSESPQAARDTFTARLMALAAAHDVLTRESWEGADLVDVVAGAVAPHRAEDADRFEVAGPAVRLTPSMALSIAMALHELATNAAKYGALSSEGGRVVIAWAVSDATLRLEWREHGGPPVVVPTRKGFGTRLIERGLAAELGGEVRLAYEPAGVACLMSVPLRPAEAEGDAAAA